MTWRAIWDKPMPQHADFDTEAAAEEFAKGQGCEVAIVPIPGTETATGATNSPKTTTDTPADEERP